MADSVTVALETGDLVSGVCGANDDNLRALEDVLGSAVSVRGNEVRVEGLSADGNDKFRFLMDELIRAVRAGESPSPDYVTAAAATAAAVTATAAPAEATAAGAFPNESQRKASFREQMILIPHGFAKVYPKTAHQAAFLEGLRTHDITFCVGPAGTGKTFLSIAWALHLVLSKKMRKIVLTRPVVEAGESLGFLPGDLAQKINPYLRPLYDAMESLVPYEIIRRMEETRAIEIAPLAYMRGRSLNDSVIILDEAQNTTREQMKMFLTRLGSHAKAVITGDTTQIDLPRHGSRPPESGLVHALSILRGVEGLHFSYLNTADVVRNPLIKKIIDAYENEKQ